MTTGLTHNVTHQVWKDDLSRYPDRYQLVVSDSLLQPANPLFIEDINQENSYAEIPVDLDTETVMPGMQKKRGRPKKEE